MYRQILSEVLKNNRIQTLTTAYSTLDSFFDKIVYDTSLDSIVYHDMKVGLYKVTFDSTPYAMILNTDITGDDYLTIYNTANAFATINGVNKHVQLYEITDALSSGSNGFTLLNTVNSYINKLVINGYSSESGSSLKSFVTQSTISSINQISLTTSNSDGSKKDKVVIRLMEPILSLNDNLKDIMILDSDKCNATITKRIGRIIIDGNEDWKRVDSLCNDSSAVFFIAYELVKVSDSLDSIRCNSLITTTLSAMSSGTSSVKYSICSGEYENTTGIYVSIPYKELHIDSDLNSFKSYLRNMYVNTPVIIDYEYNKPLTNVVTLQNYRVKSYFPKTNITINFPTKIMCFSRIMKKGGN